MEIIDFPLEGIWGVINSPADRVPSHGTNKFGLSYAMDIIGVSKAGINKKAYDKPFTEYLFHGVKKEDCFAYGRNIYSVFAGTVVAAENKISERPMVNLFEDYKYSKRVNRRIAEGKFNVNEICGNHIIIKHESKNVFCLYAHMIPDSNNYRVGDKIIAGQNIGRVGHSGNSMFPHLHMQLMDNENPLRANGIGFAFKKMQVIRDGRYISKDNYLPSKKDTIYFYRGK